MARVAVWPLVISLCLAAPAIAQSGGVGVVSAVKGEATLARAAVTSKIVQSMPVEINDKLTTQADSHLTVRFGDNSSLALGPSTTVVIDQGIVGGGAAGITRVGLIGGRIHSIFNAGLRRVGSYEVRTPNAIAGVRGTEFEVAYIAGTPCPGFPDCLRYTDVGVLKGKVEVSNPLNPKAAPVIASAGYETTVPCEQPPARPSPLGMEQMLTPSYR